MHRTQTFLALVALTLAPAGLSQAQTCCAPAATYAAPAPAVAYSPVVTQAVYRTPWYPGRNLIEWTRGLFAPRVATGSVVTAGYAPTYTAGYAPYTAAYAAPVAATQLQTTYRPVYPVTYGPVTTARTLVARPIVQTVARPVVLSPIQQVTALSPCCDPCASCDPCGVGQAVFDSPATSCPSCVSGPATIYDSSPATSGGPLEPRPRLAPQENPPAERSTLRPEVPPLPDDIDGASGETTDSGAFWEAPPLFDPKDRLTRRNPAPVWFAVDRKAKTDAPETVGGWISASR